MNAENNLLDLPSRGFEPFVFGVGAWTDHLHFGYDAVALLKPKLLVELGTDRGESYFGFCQSAAENNIQTRCFAVDSWRGDLHSGGYDETTFEQVDAHDRSHYSAFSTLLRCDFDEALYRFEDHTIDLLHIDGLHTEEAVQHDLDCWLPKLKSGGILLLHDVLVRSRGFGVWKVWDRLQLSGRSFTFDAGPGLGVWQKPPSAPLPQLLEVLFGSPNEHKDALVAYYKERAAELQKRIAQQWQDRSIRDQPFAHQTIIQVFFSEDGIYRPEDSIEARVGHGEWKTVVMSLPPGCWQGAVRIDFVSAFTTIEVAELTLEITGSETLFRALKPEQFAAVAIRGDAEQLDHSEFLRIKITGIDPQLYLPPIRPTTADELLLLRLRLRVN